MYPVELEIPFQQNISENFLNIVNQLRGSEQPGRIFDLTREPTKDELKLLINNYGNEVGFARSRQNRKWKMMEGTQRAVDSPMEDEIFDFDAHYHSSREVLAILPLYTDIFNVVPDAKYFIIHDLGLTYYSGIKKHPLTGYPWQPSTFTEFMFVYRKFLDKREPGIDDKIFWENFLNKAGVITIQKPWQRLPNNPFSGFKLEV